MFLIIKTLIVRSKIGRAFIAIRDDAQAADGMGVPIRKYKVMAFAISAFFTAFAGGLYAHSVKFISPETFTVDAMSVAMLTMVLFGGLGSMWGPILGAAAITLLKNLLQTTGIYSMILYGAFIVIVILFMPKGVVNSIKGTGLYHKLMRAGEKNVKGT